MTFTCKERLGHVIQHLPGGRHGHYSHYDYEAGAPVFKECPHPLISKEEYHEILKQRGEDRLYGAPKAESTKSEHGFF